MAQLRSGATVVTATRRLQHHVLDAYAAEQQSRGSRAWPTPAVVFWDDWLAAMWQAAAYATAVDKSPRLLLADGQELWLWEHSIRAAIRGQAQSALLSVPATARAARDAWATVQDWKLGLREITGSPGSDSAAFAAWAESFRDRCRRAGWLTRAELPAWLGNLIQQSGWLPPRQPLLLAGFDDLPPAPQELIRCLEASGVSVGRAPPPAGDGSAVVSACVDAQGELRAAAHWARRCLERGEIGPIGVVVPDLSRRRDEVERLFDRILHPDQAWGSEPATGRAFHISLGRPLHRFPLVDAALNSLQLSRPRPRREHLARFLESPFVRGWDAEAGTRSRLEALLRECGDEYLEWEQVGRLLQSDGSSSPVMVTVLQDLAELSAARDGRKPPSGWAEYFDHWLITSGWPGDRGLDSAEQQTRQSWHELLATFAGLDLVAGSVTLDTALSRIQQLAQARIFQPQSPAAPVQVLGLTETAGLEFDRLWLLGMDDTSWPPPPRPDPFLPLSLQVERGLPHANARSELACSERISRRLLASASDVRVSFARLQEDQIARVSPLFAELPAASDNEAESDEVDFVALLQRHRPILPTMRDQRGPPLVIPAAARGGASLFRDQSACPFRAFAHYRLDARGYPVAEPGFSARDRGSMVHQCLQSLWTALRSQDRLLELAGDELDRLVMQQVDAVLRHPKWGGKDLFRQRLLELERQRLAAVVREWLCCDRERPPFRVIATEAETNAGIAGVTVCLRADRVDEYHDGATLILDYKTGREHRGYGQWLGARPDEPQLPLYLLATGSRIDALAVAGVRRGDCRFIGLARDQAPAPGVEPVAQARQLEGRTWDALVAEWKAVLETLAADFAAGKAEVDPKDERKCDYCDVQPLCRIHETAAGADADD